MNEHHDPIARANPISQEDLDLLPVHQVRQELLEEIMSTPVIDRPDRRVRAHRGWLAPIAAAAAVVSLATGAWWLTNNNDPATPSGQGFSNPGAGTSGSPSAAGTPTSEPGASGYDGYQAPPRPLLIRAQGWKVKTASNIDLTWVGPGGQQIHHTWVTGQAPFDPFGYDRYDERGTKVRILGVRSRLTGFSEGGKDYAVAVTSGVAERRQTAPLFESSTMTQAQLHKVLKTAEWVSLKEYERVVRPVSVPQPPATGNGAGPSPAS